MKYYFPTRGETVSNAHEIKNVFDPHSKSFDELAMKIIEYLEEAGEYQDRYDINIIDDEGGEHFCVVTAKTARVYDGWEMIRRTERTATKVSNYHTETLESSSTPDAKTCVLRNAELKVIEIAELWRDTMREPPLSDICLKIRASVDALREAKKAVRAISKSETKKE